MQATGRPWPRSVMTSGHETKATGAWLCGPRFPVGCGLYLHIVALLSYRRRILPQQSMRRHAPHIGTTPFLNLIFRHTKKRHIGYFSDMPWSSCRTFFGFSCARGEISPHKAIIRRSCRKCKTGIKQFAYTDETKRQHVEACRLFAVTAGPPAYSEFVPSQRHAPCPAYA